MRIVILGAAGFLGSELAYRLYKNHDIVLIDNLNNGYRDNLIFPDIDLNKFFVKEDIRNNLTKWLINADVIFNFAAVSSLPVCQSEPFESFNNNVDGWLNILEQARRLHIPKLVFASTSAVYENNIKYPFKEDDFVNPTLLYSIGKLQCEELAKSYAHNYGMDITTLRFFNAYGNHMDIKRKSPPLVGYLLRCFKQNVTPILHSDGKQSRDYVHSDDICDICEAVISNDAALNNTFNVCTGVAVSVRDIVKEVKKYFPHSSIQPQYRDARLLWEGYPLLESGYSINLDWVAKETNKHSIGNNNKAKRLLSWQPKITLAAGISHILRR